ncbi:phosphoribosylaminoimidazole-succinocarboxamide synthase [Paucilactobacillus oligofermentans DSM 15707 = LMG 22743]|uniref:Phosphoribosylaminoimidazole-succinocarboxamide synthase n=1 Tax=Paucilactobacillus oligofermentans DSM 15707 = LMG 22743 TaxID=1423778 RepID=A0A0R1RGB5_9LACO|nr:phosphoribosylaminoimidazolesuccinocarboxamide synthase [Paucilactobacillus oligofermentans]KRL55406.1 phosphoribosylaminoimidazole-succinocarboxamide synthase [Paucilactobacillus oligofermentans DSM 15707 = LMG 22743]CUS25604.1 Phosphoribosylaminoimidazolesuccinocarboxamide synthase PurC [Paucilactobacillus oligofermentans DSM 15707 = LMG 22743]
MQKLAMIKEGKAKRFYETDEVGVNWVEYLDQATALNGKRKDRIIGKGSLNNQIDTILFEDLMANGIKTHFVKQVSQNEQLVKTMTMIPLEVVIRNAASGSFQRKFKVEYLKAFKKPVVETFYKSDALDDPFINESQILALEIVTETELAFIIDYALKVNQVLTARYAAAGLKLVDFKVEFGKTMDGEIVLADEISPDSCRLVDEKTLESLDKDVFRKETGDLVDVYTEVLKRLIDSQEATNV